MPLRQDTTNLTLCFPPSFGLLVFVFFYVALTCPKEYGKWHVIYKRFNRWVKDGIIEKLFRELHANGIVGFV